MSFRWILFFTSLILLHHSHRSLTLPYYHELRHLRHPHHHLFHVLYSRQAPGWQHHQQMRRWLSLTLQKHSLSPHSSCHRRRPLRPLSYILHFSQNICRLSVCTVFAVRANRSVPYNVWNIQCTRPALPVSDISNNLNLWFVDPILALHADITVCAIGTLRSQLS